MPVKIPIRNAVLHGHHDGIRREQFRDIECHRLDLMRLHRQNDQVLRSGCGVIVGGLDFGYRLLIAVGCHQADSAGAQRRQTRSPAR